MSSKECITLQTLTALELPAGQMIRTTADKRISVYDWLKAEGYTNPRATLDRLKKQHPDEVGAVVAKQDNWHQFPGERQRGTPVVDKEGFETIFALLPGKRGQAYRSTLRRIARGFFEGDPAMIDHMIERQEDLATLKRIELRARTKQTNKRLNQTIMTHGGSKAGRENIYALVGGRNNQAVYGCTAKEMKHVYGVRQTREALDSTRLSLMAMTEELETLNVSRRHVWGNQEILAAVEEVCRDIEALRRKYTLAPLILQGTADGTGTDASL